MTEQLAFKAGRAFRREGTNFVDPSPAKGAVILTNGEDGLLHFMWKNRATNNVDEVSSLLSFQSRTIFITLYRT
jgi:26S proteasome regulatory subunit N13